MNAIKYRQFLLEHGLRQAEIAKSMKISVENLNRKIRLDVLKTKDLTQLVSVTGMSHGEFLDIFYPKINL